MTRRRLIRVAFWIRAARVLLAAAGRALAEYLANRIWGPGRMRAGKPTKRDVNSLYPAAMQPCVTSRAWGGCIWRAACGTGGRPSPPTDCMPWPTRRSHCCKWARTRPFFGPSAMATSDASPEARRAILPRSGSGGRASMSIWSASGSSSRPARTRISKTATTRPWQPSPPWRGQSRVRNAHAPLGLEHSLKDRRHAPPAARLKTRRFAPSVPLVASKGAVP